MIMIVQNFTYTLDFEIKKKKFIFLLNFTLIAVAILRYYVFVPCPVSWRVKGKEERLVCQAYNFHDVSVFLMSG